MLRVIGVLTVLLLLGGAALYVYAERLAPEQGRIEYAVDRPGD